MKLFVPCLLALMALPWGASAQPGQMIQAPGQAATGPYTDANSGAIFPVTAGVFRRFRLTTGPGPQDVSAGYVDPDPAARLSVTVFIEHGPPGPGCGGLADIERSELMKSHSDATISPLEATTPDSYSSTAFAARYREDNGGGVENYYYCNGSSGMRMEYAFHHLAGFDALALEDAFIAAIAPPVRKP